MEPWDARLVRCHPAPSLLEVARERRLEYFDGGGWRPAQLDFVEESALAAAGLAKRAEVGLAIQFPVLHDMLPCLLALHLALIERAHERPCRVGVVTPNPALFERYWHRFAIRGFADRVPVAEAFPIMVDDQVRPPMLRGAGSPTIVVGRTVGRHLDGLDALVVEWGANCPQVLAPWAVYVSFDPRDPLLADFERSGRPVWGWPRTQLQLWYEDLTPDQVLAGPAWPAQRLLLRFAQGWKVRIVPCSNEVVEHALGALLQLAARSLTPLGADDGPVRMLARDFWRALQLVLSVPVRPTDYDDVASILYYGACTIRATFDRLEALARSLGPEIMDRIGPLLVRLIELRDALNESNPVEPYLVRLSQCADVLVCRNATVAATVCSLLLRAGVEAVPEVTWLRRLRHAPPVRRLVFAGMPPDYAWPSLIGVAGEVVVVVPSRWCGLRVQATVAEYDRAMARWGALESRTRAWRALTGSEPPPPPLDEPDDPCPVHLEGVQTASIADPWDVLHGVAWLADSPTEPPSEDDDLMGPPPGDREPAGDHGPVAALRIETDRGTVLLPADAVVEVLDGAEIREVPVAALQSGARLVVGRGSRRVGLLDAVARASPALQRVRVVVEYHRSLLHQKFVETGMTISELHRRLRAIGCTRAKETVQTWVSSTGPMAPQQLDDLALLHRALGTGLPERSVREVFAAIQRYRGFRRAAGRVLHEAAVKALSPLARSKRVDPHTGLSLEDLLSTVEMVTVLRVQQSPELVARARLGRLEEDGT